MTWNLIHMKSFYCRCFFFHEWSFSHLKWQKPENQQERVSLLSQLRMCCHVSVCPNWLHLDASWSDVLRNCSIWPKRSFELERHDGKWHYCASLWKSVEVGLNNIEMNGRPPSWTVVGWCLPTSCGMSRTLSGTWMRPQWLLMPTSSLLLWFGFRRLINTCMTRSNVIQQHNFYSYLLCQGKKIRLHKC